MKMDVFVPDGDRVHLEFACTNNSQPTILNPARAILTIAKTSITTVASKHQQQHYRQVVGGNAAAALATAP